MRTADAVSSLLFDPSEQATLIAAAIFDFR
jgi:hypothetical protein